MVISLDTTSCSAVRISFLALLVAQLNVPLYQTYNDYIYPLDYLNLETCTSYILFGTICINWIPCACKDGVTPTTSFDYIIVGAGPAGSTLAYRLALANTARKVLLIEAGGASDVDVVPPTWFPFDMKIASSYAYNAESKGMTVNDATNTRTLLTTDQYGLGYTNGLPCDAGKALGGGTVMNAMLFVCGTSQDYEGWKTSSGDASWGWGTGTTNNGMWWYYKKVMKMNDPNIPATCASYYGTTGPLLVSESGSNSSAIPLIKAAAQELGYPILADINCGKWIGFANIHQTIKFNERNHAARAFLSPLRNQNNLMVMRNSRVVKINMVKNPSTGVVTATGVNIQTTKANCTNFNLTASREIIISAGAYNSPKILQLSGVGRAVDLTPFGITQLIDRPVGLNYHNHPFSLHFFTTTASAAEIQDAQNSIGLLVSQATAYIETRTGPFAYVGNMMFGAFINTNDATINPNSFPNVQWSFYLFDYRQSQLEDILLIKFGIKNETAQQIMAANQNSKILMVYNILLNPKSRGIVRLNEVDPVNNPARIYTNYLTDAAGYDTTTLIQGIAKLKQLFSTTNMTSVGAALLKLNITECDTITYDTDAYWACYFKYYVQNLWHPVGTNKMGAATDTSAVVDPKLKLIGLSGTPRVRVVDASIIPVVTSGNTQCPVYAIGEKAADIIKADNP